MNALIDIVIISFAKNAECEKTTIECLKSLLSSEENSEQIFNIIVIESNPNIKYDHVSKNIKTYFAPLPYGYNKFLNFGRKKGNSEWVALCNNDLIFEKKWFSNILKTSSVYSDVLSFSPICSLTQPSLGINVNSGNFLGYEVRKHISGWCIVQKRIIYDKIGDLDESFIHWCSDNDYAITLFKNNLKHILVTDSVVVHHNHHIGITTKNVIENQNQFDAFTKGGLELLNKKYETLFSLLTFYKNNNIIISKINDEKKYKIGLCMIVKNEEKIIKRCLDSVKVLIEYVFVVDTGSDDNTISKINEWLNDNKIDGKVIQEPWKNFAYNRSFALEQIRKIKEIEYVLMIDADEILVFDKNLNISQAKQNLTKDLYSIKCNFGNIQYLKNTITKNNKPFCYKGVLHEFLYCLDNSYSSDVIEGVYNIPIQDSFRNKTVDKYKKDAQVLEEAIKKETDKNMISRYCFYLAQSYRDCGEKEKAIHWYTERIKHGGWVQEVYYSLYQIARLKEMLKKPDDEIIQSYMIAYESCPERIEAIFGAGLYCRKINKFNQAYILFKYVQNLPKPKEGLFIENWIYDYGLEDELSVCCYYVGKFKEGIELTQKILDKVPFDQKPRIIGNLEQFKKKI